jgi:hypothetical protein
MDKSLMRESSCDCSSEQRKDVVLCFVMVCSVFWCLNVYGILEKEKEKCIARKGKSLEENERCWEKLKIRDCRQKRQMSE